MIALGMSLTALAQNSNPATPSSSSATQVQKQSNAASATQDNSGISGDQVTKPAGAKSSTVIGCLGGPDSEGHFVLNSMQHRSGVEVLGPNDLGKAAGQKVKLTGEWVPAAESQQSATSSQDPAGSNDRRFQATSFEVLADKCSSPAGTTPISKKKQKQKAAAGDQNYPQ